MTTVPHGSPLNTPRALGALLRDARRRRGLTQADLASSVGLTQRTVSAVERGATDVRFGTLLRLLAALDLELVLRAHEDRDPAAVWQRDG
jgi:HTH-type transcriptional regulator/antitoxin HipB